MGAGDHGSMHVFIILFMFIRSEQLTTMSSKYNTRKPIFKKYNKSRKHVNKTKKMHRNKGKKGGAYDTNQYFVFPVPVDTAIFSGKSSIITFESTGVIYHIGKNPNAMLQICAPDARSALNQIATKVGETTHVKKNNTLSGVFYLYGTDQVTKKVSAYKTIHLNYYGLFHLLNRVQLLAVLLKLKSIPRFSSIEVHLPITERSTLPGDYNAFPHGYFYQWDNNHDNLLSFITFSQHIRRIETNLVESFQMPVENIVNAQQQIIAGLEIPPFLQMLRMRNPIITQIELGDQEEEEEEEEDDDELREGEEREDPEYLKELRQLRNERKRQHLENVMLAKLEDKTRKPKPMPSDAEVRTAIHFMNDLIKDYNEKNPSSQLSQLNPSIGMNNPRDISHVYRRISLHVNPNELKNKGTFQTMHDHYDILKRRYQNGGKKKKKLQGTKNA
jgi:hypothetical protein